MSELSLGNALVASGCLTRAHKVLNTPSVLAVLAQISTVHSSSRILLEQGLESELLGSVSRIVPVSPLARANP